MFLLFSNHGFNAPHLLQIWTTVELILPVWMVVPAATLAPINTNVPALRATRGRTVKLVSVWCSCWAATWHLILASFYWLVWAMFYKIREKSIYNINYVRARYKDPDLLVHALSWAVGISEHQPSAHWWDSYHLPWPALTQTGASVCGDEFGRVDDFLLARSFWFAVLTGVQYMKSNEGVSGVKACGGTRG